MKAKRILQKLFVQKLCFTQEHHLLDVSSPFQGALQLLGGGMAEEKRKLVNLCLVGVSPSFPC